MLGGIRMYDEVTDEGTWQLEMKTARIYNSVNSYRLVASELILLRGIPLTTWTMIRPHKPKLRSSIAASVNSVSTCVSALTLTEA